MKKIGILTYHRSINYGAFLQSYALSTKLRQINKDWNVELIDYCPQFEIDKYSTSLVKYVLGGKENRSSPSRAIRNIAKLCITPSLLRDKKKLNYSFNESYKYLPLSERAWITDDYRKFLHYIKNDYDVIIVGSDAIWETRTFPFPNAYFLDDSINAKKVSYAACTGRMFYDEYDETTIKSLKRIWESFEYIGVRDTATETLIHQICPDVVVHHNCDPSFILDIQQDNLFDHVCLENKFRSKGIDLNKPIIGIMGGDKMGRMVREFWGNKFQIIAVYYPNRFADVYLPDLTPFEWAGIFKYFSLTFTRYFHGTIFSLKNGTPTISIDDWTPNYKGQLSKLEDVLLRTDLHNHYFKVSEMDSEEGRNNIKIVAESFIRNPDTRRIEQGVTHEATCFTEFADYLRSIVGED